MITPQTPGLRQLIDRPTPEHDRRSRRSQAAGSSRCARVSTATPTRPTASSVRRDLEQIHASWTSRHGCFEIVVGSHSTGLHVKLCTWLHSGPALEECFAIHTLAEFEQWIAKAPTKFDHPIAHEEIKRFAHGNLSR